MPRPNGTSHASQALPASHASELLLSLPKHAAAEAEQRSQAAVAGERNRGNAGRLWRRARRWAVA
jgi:hypothetical protein